MSVVEIVLVAAVAGLFGAVLWMLARQRPQNRADSNQALLTALETLRAELSGSQSQSFLALRDSIDSANKVINDRLAEGAGAIDRRLAVFAEVERKLADLSAQTRNIQTIGENIQSLSELLKPPKLRGQIGEQLLENLLGDILPAGLWERQYQLAQGGRVDAVVKLGDRLLPIDAKFPLESYQRLAASPEDVQLVRQFAAAIRKHVDAISSKYICPAENTTEFALMYVPSEAVYYHLIGGADQSAFDYALANRVIPSSPGHLYSFLSSLAAVYGELHIARVSLAEGGRQLMASLSELAGSLEKLIGHQQRMEGSLRALASALERSRQEIAAMQNSLARVREPVQDEAPAPVDTNDTSVDS
jgi:DNA recombination protein RmuC